MTYLSSILLLLAIAMVTAVRLALPWCRQREHLRKATASAANKAAGRLEQRLKPGIYTFGWAGGKLTKPKAEHPTTENAQNKVTIVYFNEEQKISDILQMPYQFQKEFLGQVHSALVENPHRPQKKTNG